MLKSDSQKIKNMPWEDCPEGFKALCVILFFAIATFIVLRGFKSKVHFVYPEITNVLETNY